MYINCQRIYILFLFLKTDSHDCPRTLYIDQSGLKFKRSACLCLQSTWIKGIYHYMKLKISFFFFFKESWSWQDGTTKNPSFPSIHIRQLKTAYNSTSRISDIFGPGEHLHTHKHITFKILEIS